MQSANSVAALGSFTEEVQRIRSGATRERHLSLRSIPRKGALAACSGEELEFDAVRVVDCEHPESPIGGLLRVGNFKSLFNTFPVHLLRIGHLDQQLGADRRFGNPLWVGHDLDDTRRNSEKSRTEVV